jgi:subtilisin-like proprotein convertase family protein
LEDFKDMHHWRLRIKNSSGGEQGYLEDFHIHLG